MEMLSEVDIDLSILIDVISRDPILAATVMKYANSPIYRRLVEIKSVRAAVNLLGTKNVATALLVATMRSFNSPPSKSSEAIWEHCMGVSALARLIARSTDRELTDRAEFLATIHDIGAMTMAVNLKNYTELFQTAITQNRCLIDVEREALGYSHNDITAEALSKLKLPTEITQLINSFHNREAITQINSIDDKLLAILSLAHQLEAQVHGETRVAETMPESMETLVSLLQLSQDDLDDIIEDFEDILNNGF